QPDGRGAFLPDERFGGSGHQGTYRAVARNSQIAPRAQPGGNEAMNPISGISPIDLTRIAPSGDTARADGDFLDTLRKTMGQVEQLRADAQAQVGELLSGNGEDVHGAMIAVEKADLAFQLMMQVRNK